MSFAYLGGLSVGQIVPLALTAKANLDGALSVTLPEIQAKLDGALLAKVRLTASPPSLAASLSTAQSLVANLQAAIAAGLPNASLSITGLLAIIAELEATLGSMQARAAFSASFGVALGGAGVHLYRFEGAANQLVPGGVAGYPVDAAAKALVLVTLDSGAWSAVQTMFKTS